MGIPDIWQSLADLTREVVEQQLHNFMSIGVNLFRSFALIMIVWTGIEMALSGRGFDFSRFARFLMVLCFGYFIVTFYHGGSPLGYGFTDLITEQGEYMAGFTGVRNINAYINEIDAAAGNLGASFGWTEIVPFLMWYSVLGSMISCVAILFFIMAWGAVGQAVCIIVGPVFCAFFIVPRMDWMFWGWFKTFLQYSFYQVIAGIMGNIFGGLLWQGFRLVVTSDPKDLMINGPVYLIFFIVVALGLFKVPTLVREIFSGSAGSDSGIFGAAKAAGTATAAAL